MKKPAKLSSRSYSPSITDWMHSPQSKYSDTNIAQITQNFIRQDKIKKIITQEVKKQIDAAVKKEVLRQLNIQQNTESCHSLDKLSNKSDIAPKNMESSLLNTAQALTRIDTRCTHNEIDKDASVSPRSIPSENKNISKHHKVPAVSMGLIKTTQMQELNIVNDKESEDNNITPRTHMQTLGIVKGLIEDLKEDKVECKNKEQLKAILYDPGNPQYCLQDATIKAINELSDHGKKTLIKKISQIEGFNTKKTFLHGLLDSIKGQAKSIIIDSAREGIKYEETSKKANTMINKVFNKGHSHDDHNHDQELTGALALE